MVSSWLKMRDRTSARAVPDAFQSNWPKPGSRTVRWVKYWRKSTTGIRTSQPLLRVLKPTLPRAFFLGVSAQPAAGGRSAGDQRRRNPVPPGGPLFGPFGPPGGPPFGPSHRPELGVSSPFFCWRFSFFPPPGRLRSVHSSLAARLNPLGTSALERNSSRSRIVCRGGLWVASFGAHVGSLLPAKGCSTETTYKAFPLAKLL